MDKALLDLGAQDVEARTSSEERKLASFMLSSIMRVGEASERQQFRPTTCFGNKSVGAGEAEATVF